MWLLEKAALHYEVDTDLPGTPIIRVLLNGYSGSVCGAAFLPLRTASHTLSYWGSARVPSPTPCGRWSSSVTTMPTSITRGWASGDWRNGIYGAWCRNHQRQPKRPAQAREKAIAEWKKLIPSGTVPDAARPEGK